RAAKMQEEYWVYFFSGQLDEAYLDRLRKVGEVHARIGLGLPVYFSAMHFSLTFFTDSPPPTGMNAQEFSAALRSITKLVHLDTAVVVETFSRMTNEKIADQNRAMLEMSTPVTTIWQGILLLPLVGIIDSRRAQDLMTAMLAKIAETRSKIFILDISGVAVVDTAVANHIIKITKATRLMGCECTLSGISPAIAQTVVELGIDVGEVKTTATLRDALEEAFQRTGVKLQSQPPLSR
ncbi:MAG: protoglobin domain-containing protein, partial [Gemmataceae bacterium]